MGKKVVLIVLFFFIFVFVVAFIKKSVHKILKDFNYKEYINNTFEFLKKRKINKFQVPTAETEGESSPFGGRNTIYIFDLEMHQLHPDGSSYYKHEISRTDMCNRDGKMIGVYVSHPGAKSDGIILYGKVKNDGTFDEKDSGTYAALTVNTNAIRVGFDELGFYGEVTNPKARVYKADIHKHTEQIPYGDRFTIIDGTYILIGNQWLCFSVPSVPEFPGAKVIPNDNNYVTTKGSTKIVNSRKENKGCNDVEKTDRTVLKEISIRFPTDE